MIGFILFFSSFVYMGFEMIAARILNPYFGGGIGIWACIISTFLIGSSAGYLIGGKTADGPKNKMFIQKYLFLTGVFISCTTIIMQLLPFLSKNASIIHALIACCSLFLFPSLISSSTIPGLMKIGFGETTDSKKIGFYHMLVSVGSVSGTLLTAFIIMPHLKMKFILVVFSLMYMICGVLISFKWYKGIFILVSFLPLITLSTQTFGGLPIVEVVSSPYQDIYVTKASKYNNIEGDYRFLQFDIHSIQGAINLRDPETTMFSYIKGIMSLIETHTPNAQKLFMIGHGAGTLTSDIEKSNKEIKVAEIDEKVLELSREYFNYKGNSVIIKDGRVLLQSESDKSLDVIILDAYKSEGIPFHLLTREFFELTNKKLKNNGSIILNVLGAAEGDSITSDTLATLSSIYPNIIVYAEYPEAVNASKRQNLLFVASQSPLKPVSVGKFSLVSVPSGTILTDEWIQNTKLQ